MRSDLRFTEEHEWIRLEDDIATIGVSEHAQEELGEIVFVELPKLNKEVCQMDEVGTIESVKTVSSLFSPLTGVISEINAELEESPSLVNESSYDDGWIFKVKISDLNEYDDLMTSEEYQAFLDNQ